MEKLLTVEEAAQRLGVAKITIYLLCKLRKMRHMRLGSREGIIRIPEAALDEYVAASMVTATDEPAPLPKPRKQRKVRSDKKAESDQQ